MKRLAQRKKKKRSMAGSVGRGSKEEDDRPMSAIGMSLGDESTRDGSAI